MKWFKTDLLLNFDRRALLDNARTQFKPTHVMLDCCRVNLSIRSSNSHADCHFAAKLYTAIGYTRCAHIWCICFHEMSQQIHINIYTSRNIDFRSTSQYYISAAACGNCCWQNWQMTRNSSRLLSLLIFYIYIRGSIIFQTSNLLFCRHNKYIVCMMMRAVCEYQQKLVYRSVRRVFFPPQTFFCWFQNFNKSCPALARAHFMHSLRYICGHTSQISDSIFFLYGSLYVLLLLAERALCIKFIRDCVYIVIVRDRAGERFLHIKTGIVYRCEISHFILLCSGFPEMNCDEAHNFKKLGHTIWVTPGNVTEFIYVVLLLKNLRCEFKI